MLNDYHPSLDNAELRHLEHRLALYRLLLHEFGVRAEAQVLTPHLVGIIPL